MEDLNLLHDLNAVILDEEELSKVLTAAKEACRSGETTDMTGIMITIGLFDKAPDKAKAIIFRLQALARLVASAELQDWFFGDGTNLVPAFAREALIAAAANHPLSLVDGDISFEKRSFLRRAFELAESNGGSAN
jgi:hypothetical protein